MWVIKPERVRRWCDDISPRWWSDSIEAGTGLFVWRMRRGAHYKKVHWWFYNIRLMAMKFRESRLKKHFWASLWLIYRWLERVTSSIVTDAFRLIEEYLTRRSRIGRHEEPVWVAIPSGIDIVLVWYIVVHFEVGYMAAELRWNRFAYLTLFLLNLSKFVDVLLLWIHRRSCISCLIKWSSCCDECFKEWIN